MADNCSVLANRIMLYCHPPARFHKTSGGGGGDGGGMLSSFPRLSEFGPCLHLQGIEPPSPIITRSSSPQTATRAAATATIVVDEENIESMFSSSPALMMIPPEEEDDDYNDYFYFLSVAPEQKIFKVKNNLGLRWQREYLTPDSAVCVGSTHGWLVFYYPGNGNMYLFNPLKNSSSSSSSSEDLDHCLQYIPLPSLETLEWIKGVRLLKSDNLSPSPSIIRHYLYGDSYSTKHMPFVPDEITDFDEIYDFVLSSLPQSSSLDNDNCTVTAMMNHGGSLYFCKLGLDERWTYLRSSFCRDLIYFSKDGLFYSLHDTDRIHLLQTWDLSDHSSPKEDLMGPPFSGGRRMEAMEDFIYSSCNSSSYNSNGDAWYQKYLVESSGDLLLVMRVCTEVTSESEVTLDTSDTVFAETVRFVVFKLNFNLYEWQHVECLNDCALFVGYNHSYSLSTRDYPELTDNSIYFTGSPDNGVFHLEDNSITFYGDWKQIDPISVRVPFPVWVARK